MMSVTSGVVILIDLNIDIPARPVMSFLGLSMNQKKQGLLINDQGHYGNRQG